MEYPARFDVARFDYSRFNTIPIYEGIEGQEAIVSSITPHVIEVPHEKVSRLSQATKSIEVDSLVEVTEEFQSEIYSRRQTLSEIQNNKRLESKPTIEEEMNE